MSKNSKRKIYHDELLETGLVPWKTWKTTERKMKADGFPGHWDGGRWFFVLEEVEAWFKRIDKKAA